MNVVFVKICIINILQTNIYEYKWKLYNNTIIHIKIYL